MTFRLRYLLPAFILLLGAARPGRAQTGQFGFEVGSVAKVVQDADTLAYPWAGGLNSPQFSSIDLNFDGQPDLYAFDRESRRSYTFLNVAAATSTGRRWQYAPQYESAFPLDLEGFVLLRDYDCDGKMDIFTAVGATGNVRVLHNVGTAATGPQFVVASAGLNFTLTPTLLLNVNTGYYNLPIVQDVNGDGRLDIISYDFVGSTAMQLFLNTGTGTCTDLSSWAQVSNYWGMIQACADCRSFIPNGVAQCQQLRPTTGGRPTHSQGHTMLLLDLNGDGVLDLIDGRDNCPQLTRLLNTGTSPSPLFALGGISSNFPLAAPLATLSFPAPYAIDTDFDGVKDLLVASFQNDNSSDRITMRHSVRQYRNTSAATAVPSYAQVSDGFLQNDMIDVSEGAAPTFGDLDGDGLLDMLVGNQGDQVNGYYRASLAYYRNVGTVARPVFRLISADYLGLAATAALTPAVHFESLRPALVDLNRDGKLDLAYSVFTSTGGQLRYILNTAAAGQPASFNPALSDYFRPPGTGAIAVTAGDTPCFFDVDGDGYLDLLLGTNDISEPGSSLRYFRNRGAATGPVNTQFSLADNDYGVLRDDAGNRLANLSPTVADFDRDGQPDLLTADASGTVRLYSNFRNQRAPFTSRTNLQYNALSSSYQAVRVGQGYTLRLAPTTADLNRDGLLELYIGTQGGGIVSYLPGTRTVLATQPAAQAAAALALSVYPNPAAASVTIETAQPTSLRLYDRTGRLVREEAGAQRSRTLSLSGLAAGLYLVRATAPDGTVATSKLLVNQ
jgi:peptidoglycan hydrolase-like protein with peptidoglycan-binding domain